MNSHRYFSKLVGAFALAGLAATAAACGGSSPSTSSSSPASAPASTSAAPSSPATSSSPAASSSTTASPATVAAITTNWEAFFNAKTPVSKRVSLLQDGSQLQSIIQSQAGTGLAALATAKVTHVTVNSPTQATVTYDILVGGTPELKTTGTAVLENGTWKVGVASFCGLLTLENAGKTSGLPAVCKSAA
jgi:hypothetical protein